MTIPKSHSALFTLLQKSEKIGRNIALASILEVTGWTDSTFRTYAAKGQLSDFLHPQKDGTFSAAKTLKLTPISFSKMLSQSKHRRGLGHLCKSALSKSLLVKSRDNMLLALELYNRPSLSNKLDGFVVLFCMSWELLLKSYLIERDGEESIFKAIIKGRMRETIPLRESISRVFSEQNNKIRMNLERITYYRDKAVHLLMPEIHSSLSRLFQSGVINYATFFNEFAKVAFIDGINSGMISLVGDFQQTSVVTMKSNYGALIGEEMYQLASDLATEIASIDNMEFAIPINVELSYTAKGEKGEVIKLSAASEGFDGLKVAIVNKPTDPSRLYPFVESRAIQRINELLYERYHKEQLEGCLVCHCKKNGTPEINQDCFRSIVDKLKWKKSTNAHHREDPVLKYHTYSELAVEDFIKKVIETPGYLAAAKKSYSAQRRKKKSTKSQNVVA